MFGKLLLKTGANCEAEFDHEMHPEHIQQLKRVGF